MVNIGIAMITVNKSFREDFSRTFMQLSKIGIKELEFKTFFGFDSKVLRKSMDDYGLISLSSHERKQDMRDPERLRQMMDFHKVLGTKYITYTLGAVNTPTEVSDLINDLNTMGKVLKENGFELLYHNHAREYETRNGQYIMDYILDRVDPNYANLELDVLYLNVANGIPIRDYILSRRDRIRIVHLKDGYIDRTRTDKQDDMMFAIPTMVGDGMVKIQEAVDAVKEMSIQHLLIENEEPGANDIAEVMENYKRIVERYGALD